MEGPDCYSTDVKQTIYFDLRTNTISISKEEADFSHQHSWFAGAKKEVDSWFNGKTNGKLSVAGGWRLTSEFASGYDADGITAKEDVSSHNTDGILLAMATATKSQTLTETSVEELSSAVSSVKTQWDEYKEKVKLEAEAKKLEEEKTAASTNQPAVNTKQVQASQRVKSSTSTVSTPPKPLSPQQLVYPLCPSSGSQTKPSGWTSNKANADSSWAAFRRAYPKNKAQPPQPKPASSN